MDQFEPEAKGGSVVVGSYSTPSEAQMAVSILNGSGVEAWMLNQHTVEFNWLLSNAVGGVQVVVYEKDLEMAKALLKSPDQSESILTCPKCGSKKQGIRPLGFWGAVAILFKVPIVPRHVDIDCLECGHVYSRHIAAKDSESEPN